MPPFFQKDFFYVKAVGEIDGRKQPIVKVNVEEEYYIALKLAKEGYGGGDPEKILNMRVDLVLMMWQYEIFQADYEKAYIHINKEN